MDFVASYHWLHITLNGCTDTLAAMTDVNDAIIICNCQLNMNNLGHEWSVVALGPDIVRLCYIEATRRFHGRRQQDRANTPASTPQQYFHRTSFTIAFITDRLSEMKPTFSPM